MRQFMSVKYQTRDTTVALESCLPLRLVAHPAGRHWSRSITVVNGVVSGVQNGDCHSQWQTEAVAVAVATSDSATVGNQKARGGPPGKASSRVAVD